MVLKDVTYDLTLKQPVSLLVNTTNGSCGYMVGYGPSNVTFPLNVTQLSSCTNVTTIGSMLSTNLMATVANLVVGGVPTAEVCIGHPGVRMNCERSPNIYYSNLIGSTAKLAVFPSIFTRTANNENIVGVLNQLDLMANLGSLSAGSIADNEHVPLYFDPANSVVAGAWRTAAKTIQVFAATYPIKGWLTSSFALPQGTLIGFSFAYKPVHTPRASVPITPPVNPPSSKMGVIVGSVIGGLAAFALFIGVAIFVRKSFSFQYRKLPDH